MQIVIKQMQRSLGYDPVVKILHPGKKELQIRATVLNRVVSAASDPMREVNAYLATLSEDRQFAIYDLYRVLCEERGKISYVARELGNQLDFDSIKRWVETCLEKPEGMPYVFDPQLFPGADPQMVYLQEHYVEFQALMIIIKTLYPVMTLYGNNDAQAAGVLRMAGVQAYPAYVRLQRYVEKTILREKPQMAKQAAPKIFDALLYRRLSVAELEAEHHSNLVAYSYRYVIQKLRSLIIQSNDNNVAGQP